MNIISKGLYYRNCSLMNAEYWKIENDVKKEKLLLIFLIHENAVQQS